MSQPAKTAVPGQEPKQIHSYRDLAVWQRAVEIAVECYRVTQGFPKHETYGLSAQLQRAAVSISANIAEGRARKYTREFLHHLSIAYGSLAELATHIEIARRLSYLPSEKADALLDDCEAVGRMINGLHNSLQKRAAAQQPSPVPSLTPDP